MKVNKLHEGICGIYGIRNLINNKIYIGKSVNIRQRIYNHIGGLNAKDPKRENDYFIRSWWKYGRNNFEYFIIEILDITQENIENLAKERELFWMTFYKSSNREFGYNLRMDSSTTMIVHEETKKRYSEARIKQYNDKPELKEKISKWATKFWKENPEIKEEMKKKVSDKHTRYEIHQYSKDGFTLIKVWNKVKDIILENPNYKVHNIYAVCSGEKPTMYGYKWIKVLKDDIVRSE